MNEADATSTIHPVLVGGSWRASRHVATFRAVDPISGVPGEELYPVSSQDDAERAVRSAREASEQLLSVPDETRAHFLERYAGRIEAHKRDIAAVAHGETGLPIHSRLVDIELMRTCDQLRQAAKAAREGSWREPTIDTRAGVRSLSRFTSTLRARGLRQCWAGRVCA